MLTPQEIRQLSQTSVWNTWKAVLGDWAIISLLFYLGIHFPSPLVLLGLMIVMGRQQLALGLLMHDAAHGRLFKSRLWNDAFCQFTCAGPLFFSLYSYKHFHFKHHRNPLAADDPDITLIGGYPIDKRSFYRKLLRDLFGISYFKFIRYFLRGSQSGGKNSKSRKIAATPPNGGQKTDEQTTAQANSTEKNLLPPKLIFSSMVLTHLLLFGVLLLSGHPGMYFLLWVLPSMTFLQVYLRIRGIAEHAGYQPNPDQSLNARTVVNPIQTFLWAPHFVHFHIEHHLYPSVPYFRLPQVHTLLKDRGALPEANVYSGYGQVLRDLLIKAPPA